MPEDLRIEDLVGQVVAVGFPGHAPTPEVLQLIQRYRVGNVILFSRNVRDVQQLRELTATLQRAAFDAGHRQPLLIMIDQENGVVRRLGQGASVLPGSMALGAAGDPECARQVALATGRELRALGINMNLAPVADVNNNPANPVIGVRSFGEDPQAVGDMVAAAVEGYAEAGVISCLKHFPGHGDTAVDSHLALPVVPHDRARLESVELPPFRRGIEAGTDSIMVAHLHLPAIMANEAPSTVSPEVIDGLLRGALGFGGLVITDCLEMRAVSETIGTERAAVLAIASGADVALISHRHDRQVGAVRALYAALREGALSEDRLRDAADRVMRLKERLSWREALGGSVPDWVGGEEHARLAQRVYEASVTLVRDDWGLLPLDASALERVAVLYPAREEVTWAEDNRFPQGFAAAAVARRGVSVEGVPVPAAHDAETRAAVLRQVEGADLVIYATLNAHLYPDQAALMRGLLEAQVRVIGIAVRNPYDLLAFPALGTYLATYEYTPGAVEAAVRVMFGEVEPRGRLPVSLPGLYPRGHGLERGGRGR